MIPVLALVMSFVPDPDLLGADDYHQRETETRRCDNLISAALLPTNHPNPEARKRIGELRAKNLRHADPLYVEVCVLRAGFPRWVELYLSSDRSRLARTEEFFLREFHGQASRWEFVLRVLPVPPGESDTFFRRPWRETDYPRYLEWLDYHHFRAPAPRQK
jgi:hypothetical protein